MKGERQFIDSIAVVVFAFLFVLLGIVLFALFLLIIDVCFARDDVDLLSNHWY